MEKRNTCGMEKACSNLCWTTALFGITLKQETKGAYMRKRDNRAFLERLARAEGVMDQLEGLNERYKEAIQKLEQEERSAPTSPLRFNSQPQPAYLDPSKIESFT